MIVILVISIIINVLLLLKFYQDQKFNKRLSTELDWIIKGDALAELKENHSSTSQDELVKKLNRLIGRLKKIQIEYEEVYRQNSQMISSISHDFRTPITSMLGYIQILKESTQNEREAKFLNIIEDRTALLNELVEDFYRLSLLDSNENPLVLTAASPVRLLQDQIALYYEELDATFDHIAIQLIDERVVVQTSKTEFNRLISNLIKNAFTHGKERLCIYNESSEDSMMIYFENKVTNPEIIDVSRLFDRTYKVDQSRQSMSTGLGLSISLKIAEMLGYELDAQLEKDRLQFKLTIPIKSQ